MSLEVIILFLSIQSRFDIYVILHFIYSAIARSSRCDGTKNTWPPRIELGEMALVDAIHRPRLDVVRTASGRSAASDSVMSRRPARRQVARCAGWRRGQREQVGRRLSCLRSSLCFTPKRCFRRRRSARDRELDVRASEASVR